MPPPRLTVPGLNRGRGIPSKAGYLLGRTGSTGRGPVQLLDTQELLKIGLVSTKTPQGAAAAIAAAEAGFMFSISGLVPANTLLGTASWSKDLTFLNGEADNSYSDVVNPTSAYAFRIMHMNLTQVGEIDVTTAGVGTVVWVTNGMVWPAGVPMLVYTQLAADSTLAGISARVVGHT